MAFSTLRQDIAYVWRSCRRQPGFALTALATLTIGIGANTAASAPKVVAWTQQRDIFTHLSAYRGGFVNLTSGGDGAGDAAVSALARQVSFA